MALTVFLRVIILYPVRALEMALCSEQDIKCEGMLQKKGGAGDDEFWLGLSLDDILALGE